MDENQVNYESIRKTHGGSAPRQNTAQRHSTADRSFRRAAVNDEHRPSSSPAHVDEIDELAVKAVNDESALRNFCVNSSKTECLSSYFQTKGQAGPNDKSRQQRKYELAGCPSGNASRCGKSKTSASDSGKDGMQMQQTIEEVREDSGMSDGDNDSDMTLPPSVVADNTRPVHSVSASFLFSLLCLVLQLY